MATKKKGVMTGPDPDDRIVHETMRKDYPRMSQQDRARYDRADAAYKGASGKTKPKSRTTKK